MEPWRKALTALIKKHGQPAVVAALKVDTSTVSRWKSGERWPEPGMVVRICDALKVTPDQLYGFKAVDHRPTSAELKRAAAHLDAAKKLLVVSAAQEAEAAPLAAAGRQRVGKRSRRPRGATG
jgi:transcriptional regulator with XRE-family HTH domain